MISYHNSGSKYGVLQHKRCKMTWIIFWIGNGTANLQFFMQELLLNLNNIINFAVLI